MPPARTTSLSETVNHFQLLANVAKFYREQLRKDKSGRELAESLGLHDPQILERFQIGYANDKITNATPSRGAVRNALVEIGLLNAEGNETITGCLVIPALDRQENVTGFVAIGKEDKEMRLPASLSFFDVNLEAFKEKEMIFTDTAIETLLFAQAGFINAVPVNAELTDEERTLIEKFRPQKAYFCDELPELLRLLQRFEVPCYKVTVNFPATGKQIEHALKTAEPIAVSMGPDAVVRVTDELIKFECGARKYEVKELTPNDSNRMRVRIRAVGEILFNQDNVELYASRSRTGFARVTAPIFGVSESAIEGDLCLMITKLEAMRAVRKMEAEDCGKNFMTFDEEAEAKEYLKAPDILERVAKDMEILGYVGEEVNKKIGYLITISRKLESPLSGVIISRASAGKSKLLEVLSDLVPPEDLVSYTRITPQALYYAENRSLRHKLMISGEDEGILGSDYAIRELISAKKIRLAAPVKDMATGKMKTVEYEVEGPIALLFSTTQPAIHYENSTRCFILSLDESIEQTARIHYAQGFSRTLEGKMRSMQANEIRNLHKNVQRLLRPVFVVNPYAQQLSFPMDRLESRREYEKYLSLIETAAFLRQYQKPVKKIPQGSGEVESVEVEAQDIEEANKLITEILGTSADELSRPSRELLKQVREMVEKKSLELEISPTAYRFNRRDIREYTGWSDNQIKAHIKQLEELQYLLVKQGERGKMYRYELANETGVTGKSEKKRLFGLTDVKKLEKLGVVGQKLGEPAKGGTDEKIGSSWEVGHFGEKAYTSVQSGSEIPFGSIGNG